MPPRTRLLPKVPTRRPSASSALTVLFRVLQKVTHLPPDIAPDSPEGQALLGAELPNGYIGMVSAATPTDLFWRIDEFVDPGAVELMLLPEEGGGICIFDPSAAVLPTARQADGTELMLSIAEVAASDLPPARSLEYSESLDERVSLQGLAMAEWQLTDKDPGWAEVFAEYARATKRGGWFKPKWSSRVYG